MKMFDLLVLVYSLVPMYLSIAYLFISKKPKKTLIVSIVLVPYALGFYLFYDDLLSRGILF